MHRVIDNIVKNAVEAMPNGGRLTLRGVRGTGHVSLSISDTGVGIPEEIREEVFAPLFTTKSGGMGLGLNFCRRAVEAHRGSIEFESEINKGTTFMVRLPLDGVEATRSGSET
jgi:signal transduction histidine kinase